MGFPSPPPPPTHPTKGFLFLPSLTGRVLQKCCPTEWGQWNDLSGWQILITSCFLAKQATFVFYLFSPFILYYRPLILYYRFEDIFLQILKNTRLQEVERKVSTYTCLA